MKNNGRVFTDAHKWGGFERTEPWVHTFYIFIPPETYFASHPEWFSLINGVRTSERAQLCLTNAAMRAEFVKNLKAYIHQQNQLPSSYLQGNPVKYTSVSQNDWGNPCQCANCQAIAATEESEAGPILYFANKVAEEIEAEFPDMFVETLAYQYSRKPPKTLRPRNNVTIRYCTIEADFSQPISTGTRAENQAIMSDLTGWSAIADRVAIWDYVVNFNQYLWPHANYGVLENNIETFIATNAFGLYEQADAFTTVGDLIRLKAWCLSKYAWDQSTPFSDLVDTFIEGYYGTASLPFIRDYLQLLTNRVQDSGVFLRMASMPGRDMFAWMDYETLTQASTLFEQAIDAVTIALGSSSPEVTRLKRDKMPIDLVWLLMYNQMQRYATFNNLTFAGPADPLQATLDYFNLADTYGNTRLAETDGENAFEIFRQNLIAKFERVSTPPDFVEELPDGSWLEFQESGFSVATYYNLASFVDDAAASNGRAMKIGESDATPWLIHQRFDPTLFQMPPTLGDANRSRYEIYIAVRCDDGITDGDAIRVGVYETPSTARMQTVRIQAEQIRGSDYTWVFLGSLHLDPSKVNDTFIWISPPGRLGVTSYVDRFVVVKRGYVQNTWIANTAKNFSDPTAWSRGTVPGAFDTVVLDELGSGNFTLDVNNATIGGFKVLSTYAGTWSLNGNKFIIGEENESEGILHIFKTPVTPFTGTMDFHGNDVFIGAYCMIPLRFFTSCECRVGGTVGGWTIDPDVTVTMRVSVHPDYPTAVRSGSLQHSSVGVTLAGVLDLTEMYQWRFTYDTSLPIINMAGGKIVNQNPDKVINVLSTNSNNVTMGEVEGRFAMDLVAFTRSVPVVFVGDFTPLESVKITTQIPASYTASAINFSGAILGRLQFVSQKDTDIAVVLPNVSDISGDMSFTRASTGLITLETATSGIPAFNAIGSADQSFAMPVNSTAGLTAQKSAGNVTIVSGSFGLADNSDFGGKLTNHGTIDVPDGLLLHARNYIDTPTGLLSGAGTLKTMRIGHEE